MLKKAIFLCFFVPVVLLAGDDQTKYSESGKLYVSIGKNMISSSEQFKQLLENRGGNGLANSKNWHSYLGSVEIMEHEFFQTVGSSDMAGAAQSHTRFLKSLDFLGPGLALTSCGVSGVGCGIALINLIAGDDPNPTMIYAGLVGVGVGLSLGVVRFLARGRRYTASVAVEKADEYNKRQTK